jgi:WD40 repeat protein
LYPIERVSRDALKRGEVDLEEHEPLATYRFEESGISSLCALTPNLFISAAVNRSIDVWDTRQQQPILHLKDVHFDRISAVDKLNHQIFASASHDGYVNVSTLLFLTI